MKMKQLFIYTTCAAFFLSGCKKDDTNASATTPPKDGNLNIVFDNMIGDNPVVMSQLSFLNAAGNTYSVSLLKYYVSNIELHKKEGSVVKPGNYELINAADPASCTFSAGMLTPGDYDSMVFYIGIDPTRNHTGVQDGDLDVSKGMFWTWNTGYNFFKHEGQYKNTAGQTKALIFHYGTDEAYTKISIPINLTINGDKTMHLKFDLNSCYTSPVNIDFNVDNSHQSDQAGDAEWIANMKANFADAFSFSKVD